MACSRCGGRGYLLGGRGSELGPGTFAKISCPDCSGTGGGQAGGGGWGCGCLAASVCLLVGLSCCIWRSNAGYPQVEEQWTGRVSAVVDGDTVIVARDDHGEPVTVQFFGMIAPELDQPRGQEAKAALENAVLGKPVTVTVYQTVNGVPRVNLAHGWNWASLSLVHEGWLWQDPEHPELAAVSDAVNSAKWYKKGLWADPDPTQPWVWREQHPKK